MPESLAHHAAKLLRKKKEANSRRAIALSTMQPVRTFEQVFALAERKRCVWHAGRQHHIPASVAANWPAQMLYNCIVERWLFVYVRRKGAR